MPSRSGLASAVGSGGSSLLAEHLAEHRGPALKVIVEERFRHQLGKFYTPEDVVDVLTAFAIRDPNDLVLDPATGGGSFLRSAYARKRDFGANHERSLADIWGCEITAFAAELSTVTLATSDTHELQPSWPENSP